MRWYAKVIAVGILGLLLMGFGLTLFVPAGAETVVFAGAAVLSGSLLLLLWRILTPRRGAESR